jgi:hypothetical protein
MHMNFKLNKKIIKGKNAVFSLSLILMLSMTIIIALAQPSLAQIGIPQPEKTVGYITVAPTIVGVGQQLTVNLWINPLPTDYKYYPYYDGYRGVTVTFVKPDGTKDTFMPTDATCIYVPGQTQSLGAIYFFYAPSMAGNWSVSFTMPAQNLTDSTGTVLYSGCTSNTFDFTVQTDPILAGLLNGYPWSPLPNANAYWSYPINSNNREWSQISGDWLASSSANSPINGPGGLHWQPYGSGPSTAHIVWSQSFREGGIMGGVYGSTSYGAQGSQFSTTITDGKLYVNIPNTTPVGQSFGKFECIDLTTGKLLYIANGSITCSINTPGNAALQAYLSPTGNVDLGSSYGSSPTPYLYGTVTVAGVVYWNYYDPITGVLLRQINNCSSARLIDNSNMAFGAANSPTVLGGAYVYGWNMSKVVNNVWTTGIQWKTPLPTSQIYTTTGMTLAVPALFGVSADLSTVVIKTSNQYWGYDANNGASLWNLTLNYPTSANEQFCLQGVDDFVILDPVASTFNCYSMRTGTLLWTSTSFSDSPWATSWTLYWSEANDMNNLYAMFPDGTTRAYSLKDGHQVWASTPFPSTEYNENAVPMTNSIVLVGGNVYVFAGYSSQYKINPIPRSAMLVCINATTGDISWTLNGGLRPSSAADGYVIGTGDYDGNLYCVGKGQTTTTVSAPQTTITSATPVTISGKVMDQSAIQPNTPAISDADMSVWMDYLYMQNSTLLNSPPQCTGVPVTLTAVDPNGNTITIGSTTSNYQGNYGLQWTPTTPGLYTIYATFAGSNSYYTSSASTYATVASASTTSSPTTPANSQPLVSNSDLATYLAIGVIAIIISIAIVGALLLRKR